MSDRRIQTLSDRLTTGWAMCEQERDPRRRKALEDYWIKLLGEYERACDAVGHQKRGAA